MSKHVASLNANQSSLLVRDLQGDYREATAEEVLIAARRVLSRRVRRGTPLTSPDVAKDILRVRLSSLEHEVFAVFLLDT